MPMGSGMSSGSISDVYALAVLPNGDLVAGGHFTSPAVNIARWNGSSWSAMGTGLNNAARALTVLPSGNIVAGGLFTMAGGSPANYVAQWNGTSWAPLGSTAMHGMDNQVLALATLSNGDLIAGGLFTIADGVPANRVARWDGSSWHPLAEGTSGAIVALQVMANGDLIAGGAFNTAGNGVQARNIARWDGMSWSTVGSGLNNTVNAMAQTPSGDLLAGGVFTAAGSTVAPYFARFHFPHIGDLNCDGTINNFDIDAFVLALMDSAQYAVLFPHCDRTDADANCDGRIDNFDIDPFVACLVAGGCP